MLTQNEIATQSNSAPQTNSLASFFEEGMASHADSTALTLGKEQLTYAELDRMANGIAAALLQHGVQSNQVVALYLDRSFALIAAMLGAWKAGCAYLPIEVTSPAPRTQHILSDSKAAVVLTDTAHAADLASAEVSLIKIDTLKPEERYVVPENISENDPAYVIYTSGSTGKPKGVVVTHRNLRRLLEQTQPWFHFTERDVWTMFHSSAFDFSVWEIWGCLMHGGCLVIVPFHTSRSPESFYGLLADEGVTVLNQTPTAFTMLIDAESRVPQRPLALRLIILGGEALQLPSLLPFFRRHKSSTPQIVNMYGITETTVHVTARFIHEEDVLHTTDSLIGTPIPDLKLYLLDENLSPVPQGEVGEICIAGAGVARGYLNQSELTASRFVANPFTHNGETMYRSGDLGRIRADGELIYVGRADNQVKVNGFRIELGEVESVLATCQGIAQVCICAHTDSIAGTRLAAYFVSTGNSVDARTLSAFAQQNLPAYMRPSFYLPLAGMPINANGKVDRSALPSPLTASASSLNASLTSLEERIAAVWRQVLQVDAIDADTNFFDAGGNSLLLVTLRNRLQEILTQEIPVTWMFEATTVRTFAARMHKTSSVQKQPSQSAAQRQRQAFANVRASRGGTR